jgi:predicted Kef-type K+ transport protein
MLESVNGRIAVGWLVVQDLATVLVLVLLPPLAGALAIRRSGGCAAGHNSRVGSSVRTIPSPSCQCPPSRNTSPIRFTSDSALGS